VGKNEIGDVDAAFYFLPWPITWPC